MCIHVETPKFSLETPKCLWRKDYETIRLGICCRQGQPLPPSVASLTNLSVAASAAERRLCRRASAASSIRRDFYLRRRSRCASKLREGQLALHHKHRRCFCRCGTASLLLDRRLRRVTLLVALVGLRPLLALLSFRCAAIPGAFLWTERHHQRQHQ